jgi:hypothetical protein
LIGIKRWGVVRKDAISFALEILELPLVHGPSEDGDDEEHEHRRLLGGVTLTTTKA